MEAGATVVALAALTAAGVVYLTSGDETNAGTAAPGADTFPVTTEPEALAADAGLDAIVPAAIWKDCRLQTVPEQSAIQTAGCPAGGVPDRWDISSYPSGAALNAAYAGELRNRPDTQRNKGKCNAFSGAASTSGSTVRTSQAAESSVTSTATTRLSYGHMHDWDSPLTATSSCARARAGATTQV